MFVVAVGIGSLSTIMRVEVVASSDELGNLILKLVIKFLCVFQVTENYTTTADQIITSLVFCLRHPSCHISGGGWVQFQQNIPSHEQ